MPGCESYLKDTTTAPVMMSILSSCGCSLDYLPLDLCRDLHVVTIPNPISWSYRFICKKTATSTCQTSVEEVSKIWNKVPTKDDKVCFDYYQETQMWDFFCNPKWLPKVLAM